MRTVRLELRENQCGACSTRFESRHLTPNTYGPVLFTTQAGEAAFLFPDDDLVWGDVSAWFERTPSAARINKVEGGRLFDAALAETVDSSESGFPYYAWGTIPCPTCGSFERSDSRPLEPPQFVEVELRQVSHHAWHGLSEEEKERRLERVRVKRP